MVLQPGILPSYGSIEQRAIAGYRAMGSEASLWKTLRKRLEGNCQYSRHEDSIGAGIPDVSYSLRGTNGWIELKYLPDFPKRAATPVRVRHFTDNQRAFIWGRGKEGGYCWVLLQVDRQYLLFDWTMAYLIGTLPRDELLARAFRSWSSRFVTDELLAALQVRI